MSKSSSIPLVPLDAPLRSKLGSGWMDLASGLRLWRTWWYLALRDVRRMYSRTVIGPWWGVLQDGLFIGGVSVLWGPLFGKSTSTYFVHFGLGLITFNFISQLVSDASRIYVMGGPLTDRVAGPLSSLSYQLVAASTIRLMHSALILIVFAAIGWVHLTLSSWWAFVGTAFILLNGLAVGLWLGTATARYRDVGPAVDAAMRIAFFMTPVMWVAGDVLDGPRAAFVAWNPLYYLLESVRGPLMNAALPPQTYIGIAMATLTHFAIGVVVFSLGRSHLPYWSSR